MPGLTLGLDWAQEMAQQKAIFIAGTGYQYADTNFLAYSAKIYTMLADELRAGAVGTPVAIGQALVKAKQDYLETLSTVGGIDQKAVIESTMYGLPMTGLDLTGQPHRQPLHRRHGQRRSDVAAGTPGATLGLSTAVITLPTPTTPNTPPGARPQRHRDRPVVHLAQRTRRRRPDPACTAGAARAVRAGDQHRRAVAARRRVPQRHLHRHARA